MNAHVAIRGSLIFSSLTLEAYFLKEECGGPLKQRITQG
jgi:hypothetical protein